MEKSTPMAPSDKGESVQQLFVKFKPTKCFIKFNDTINNNNVNATTGVPPISKVFKRERQFTPLNESLHIIVSYLLQRNVIKIPPIKPVDPSKLASPYFDSNSFCQFHCQPGHDTEKYFALKSEIQDLIDNNTIFVAGVNDKGNKSIAPPKQNLKIFTNPLPSHTSNVIETEHTSFSPSNLTTTTLNLVNMVEKQKTPKDPCITLDPSKTIRVPDGILYIVVKVNDIPCHGALFIPLAWLMLSPRNISSLYDCINQSMMNLMWL
ncbi:hypothetical protein SUGI_0880030 [Cryptomeria japonica]|nr:hypothetical protein SUGI_0880030 [Cryptomeria japonica]